MCFLLRETSKNEQASVSHCAGKNWLRQVEGRVRPYGQSPFAQYINDFGIAKQRALAKVHGRVGHKVHADAARLPHVSHVLSQCFQKCASSYIRGTQ